MATTAYTIKTTARNRLALLTREGADHAAKCSTATTSRKTKGNRAYSLYTWGVFRQVCEAGKGAVLRRRGSIYLCKARIWVVEGTP